MLGSHASELEALKKCVRDLGRRKATLVTYGDERGVTRSMLAVWTSHWVIVSRGILLP